MIAEPAANTPEYTLKKVNVPTNGSVAILNAKAEKPSSSEASLVTSSSLSSIPFIAGMSKGDGNNLITPSSIA